MTERAAVILAAGQGTRMRSPTPKVLHKVGGRTMLDRAIDAAEGLGCDRIVVVAGRHSPAVAAHARARLGEDAVVFQEAQLGTGDAVRAAEAALAGFAGDVLVAYADTPLLDADAFAGLFEARAKGADVAVLGFYAADPGAYGRLILGEGDALDRIVEAKDATAEVLRIAACNSGVLAAPAGLLFDLLRAVRNDNAKGGILSDRRGGAGARTRSEDERRLRRGSAGARRERSSRTGRRGSRVPDGAPGAGLG